MGSPQQTWLVQVPLGLFIKEFLMRVEQLLMWRFSHLRHQGAFKIFKSFIAECKALRNIRHRNLIKVLTACLGVDYQGNDFKALVYEFIHNRSPEKWLYPISKEDETYERPRNLNLLRRLNIAIDVASALNYLHHDCQPVTAHCDLKPSNVLLDDDMTARVGDFGLARFLPPTRTQTSSIDVKWSIGYIAPGIFFYICHTLNSKAI